MAVSAEATAASTPSFGANNTTISVALTIYLILCVFFAAVATDKWVTPKLSQSQSQQRWMLSIGITSIMTVIFLSATPFIGAQMFLQLVVRAGLDVCYSSVEKKLDHGIMRLFYKDSPDITTDELIERHQQQKQQQQQQQQEEINNRMVVLLDEPLEPQQQQPASNRMAVRLSKRFLELPPICYVLPYMHRPIPSYLAPAEMAFYDSLVVLRKQMRNGRTSATEESRLAVRQSREPVRQSNRCQISTDSRLMRKFHRGELAPLLPRDETATNDNQDGFIEASLQGTNRG
ncbi:uncharacterized protein PG998_003928 [Apiospora kogelbergensis]|uniref:Uncharacterized protein n=1 Tax=Apiospora kogelbergensis TaxID=1337665 RepID=A0AAW0QK79_9PEZI